MFRKAVLFSLLSLVLIVSATGLECMIYVSSSDGINNTSCWTGGYQTPCATLDLALQGTTTVQDKCSSGTVINLSPGNYTLDTTTLLEQQQLLRNNVSIIGMRNGSRYEEVNITCLHVSSSSYHWLGYIVFQCVSLYNCNNVPVSCTQPSFDLTTHNAISQELCPNLTLNVEFINLPLQCYPHTPNEDYECYCDNPQFTVSILDNCNNKQYDWNNELNVCVATTQTNYGCSNVMEQSYCNAAYDYVSLCYELDNFCLNSPIDPFKVSLYIQTLGLITINISTTVNVTTELCTINGKCWYLLNCDTINVAHFIPHGNHYYGFNHHEVNNTDCLNYCNNECCYDNSIQQCFANCTSDTGVPINILTCVNCEDYPLGILVFILIEILPITLMVILIIILNIQLTNGSINGVVFYSQIIAIIYSFYYNPEKISLYVSKMPCSIFNLDFTPLLYNYPLCIAPHMSPLGAISFWYVIGFYPLLLLLLIYVWIILYDKGFMCVVFITRPFHRCMARFWSMTGIEPSLTNSIASIYILSFTQLTATSFKILSISPGIINNVSFFYDQKQDYFHGVHGFAGSFAILVLLIVILLPTLYIQFYPFKWFHKLLDCLHLRKQLLISLGDVFTGPYKNGSKNTFDYRFMAGLYLWARIITLSSCVLVMFLYVISITLACCSFVLALIILIFRPFKRNIHNFSEVLIACIILALGIMMAFIGLMNVYYVVLGINCFILGIPMFVGLIYATYRMLKACDYCSMESPVTNRIQEDTEPLVVKNYDWIADRMENPQEYNEQHVTDRLDEESEEHHQPITIATAATYGSINNST